MGRGWPQSEAVTVLSSQTNAGQDLRVVPPSVPSLAAPSRSVLLFWVVPSVVQPSIFIDSISFQRPTWFSNSADLTGSPVSNCVKNESFSGNGVGNLKTLYCVRTKELSLIFKIN